MTLVCAAHSFHFISFHFLTAQVSDNKDVQTELREVLVFAQGHTAELCSFFPLPCLGGLHRAAWGGEAGLSAACAKGGRVQGQLSRHSSEP